MKSIKRYWQVWKITALNTWQEVFINRGTNILFIFGKTVRFSMSLLFLFLIKGQLTQLGGYSTDQMIIFFLTYQFIDVLAQVFYRGVYNFRDKILQGNLDFALLKPIKPLFQALTGKPDINDVIFIIPTTLLSIYLFSTLNIQLTLVSISWYVLLLINAFLIATAFHILILSLGILTTEINGFIWLYRDLISLGRFPINIYLEPLRFALFFIIPVGMMITIPAEVLLNLKPTYSIGVALIVGWGSLWGSLKLWRWSLKKYASASS